MMSKLVNHHGKTVVTKGLNILGSQLWSKIALIMIGGMNVISLAGGVAISKIVDIAFNKLSKNKRMKNL